MDSVPIPIILVFSIIGTVVSGPHYDFEDPSQSSSFRAFYSIRGISSAYHKTGSKSLLWQWVSRNTGSSAATLSLQLDPLKIQGKELKKGGIKWWMYRENREIKNNMTIVFKGENESGALGHKTSSTLISLNFEGWRAVWIGYEEFGNEMSTFKSITGVEFKLTSTAADKLYFDTVRFATTIRKQTRDMIVKKIGSNEPSFYDEKDFWQQSLRWHTSPVPSKTSVPRGEILKRKLKEINLIESALQNWYVDERETLKTVTKFDGIALDFAMDPEGGLDYIALKRNRWKLLQKDIDKANEYYNKIDFKNNGTTFFSKVEEYGEDGISDFPYSKTKFGFIFSRILLPLSLEYNFMSRPSEVIALANKVCTNLKSSNFLTMLNAITQITGDDQKLVKSFQTIFNAQKSRLNCGLKRVFNMISGTDLIDMYNELVRWQRIKKLLVYIESQGWAEGSGLGSLDHEMNKAGSGFMHSMFLLRNVLRKEKKLFGRLLKTMKWYNDFNEIYQKDKSYLYDGTTADRMRTITLFRLMIILISPVSNEKEQKEKVQGLEHLTQWIKHALKINRGLGGLIKEDGTAFHHKTFYGSAYVPHALHNAALVQYLLEHTDSFKLDRVTKKNIRKALKVLRLTNVKYSSPNSIGGRFPGYSNGILAEHFAAYAYVSYRKKDKKEKASGKDMFLRLFNHTEPFVKEYLNNGTIKSGIYYWNTIGQLDVFKKISSLTCTRGCKREMSPTGHWAKNFASLSIHRRKDWAVTAKGFNRYVWDFEKSAKENRYGAFASHGALQISNSEASLESYDVNNGWDWTRVPGATTIKTELVNIELEKSRDYNPGNFAGGIAFTGSVGDSPRNGAFGMYLKMPDYNVKNKASLLNTMQFEFKKSYFFYNELIVCIGSDIKFQNHDIKNYYAQTTLFQDKLKDPQKPSTIRYDSITHDLRLLLKTYDNWSKGTIELVDTNGNIYQVKNAKSQGLRVEVSNQESLDPSGCEKTKGRYATAWFEHKKRQTERCGAKGDVSRKKSKKRKQHRRKHKHNMDIFFEDDRFSNEMKVPNNKTKNDKPKYMENKDGIGSGPSSNNKKVSKNNRNLNKDNMKHMPKEVFNKMSRKNKRPKLMHMNTEDSIEGEKSASSMKTNKKSERRLRQKAKHSANHMEEPDKSNKDNENHKPIDTFIDEDPHAMEEPGEDNSDDDSMMDKEQNYVIDQKQREHKQHDYMQRNGQVYKKPAQGKKVVKNPDTKMERLETTDMERRKKYKNNEVEIDEKKSINDEAEIKRKSTKYKNQQNTSSPKKQNQVTNINKQPRKVDKRLKVDIKTTKNNYSGKQRKNYSTKDEGKTKKRLDKISIKTNHSPNELENEILKKHLQQDEHHTPITQKITKNPLQIGKPVVQINYSIKNGISKEHLQQDEHHSPITQKIIKNPLQIGKPVVQTNHSIKNNDNSIKGKSQPTKGDYNPYHKTQSKTNGFLKEENKHINKINKIPKLVGIMKKVRINGNVHEQTLKKVLPIENVSTKSNGNKIQESISSKANKTTKVKDETTNDMYVNGINVDSEPQNNRKDRENETIDYSIRNEDKRMHKPDNEYPEKEIDHRKTNGFLKEQNKINMNKSFLNIARSAKKKSKNGEHKSVKALGVKKDQSKNKISKVLIKSSKINKTNDVKDESTDMYVNGINVDSQPYIQNNTNYHENETMDYSMTNEEEVLGSRTTEQPEKQIKDIDNYALDDESNNNINKLSYDDYGGEMDGVGTDQWTNGDGKTMTKHKRSISALEDNSLRPPVYNDESPNTPLKPPSTDGHRFYKVEQARKRKANAVSENPGRISTLENNSLRPPTYNDESKYATVKPPPYEFQSEQRNNVENAHGNKAVSKYPNRIHGIGDSSLRPPTYHDESKYATLKPPPYEFQSEQRNNVENAHGNKAVSKYPNRIHGIEDSSLRPPIYHAPLKPPPRQAPGSRRHEMEHAQNVEASNDVETNDEERMDTPTVYNTNINDMPNAYEYSTTPVNNGDLEASPVLTNSDAQMDEHDSNKHEETQKILDYRGHLERNGMMQDANAHVKSEASREKGKVRLEEKISKNDKGNVVPIENEGKISEYSKKENAWYKKMIKNKLKRKNSPHYNTINKVMKVAIDKAKHTKPMKTEAKEEPEATDYMYYNSSLSGKSTTNMPKEELHDDTVKATQDRKTSSYEYAIVVHGGDKGLFNIYEVLQANSKAHIVSFKGIPDLKDQATEVYAYAIFEPNQSLEGIVKRASAPCMVMAEYGANKLYLAVSNPALTFKEDDEYKNRDHCTRKERKDIPDQFSPKNSNEVRSKMMFCVKSKKVEIKLALNLGSKRLSKKMKLKVKVDGKVVRTNKRFEINSKNNEVTFKNLSNGFTTEVVMEYS